ncbi:putative FRE ferric reductase-like transmembrane component [Aspergillus ellipticus CBS 707.79]|uniref:Putative FRE ferric reductase-like transmembrane component n=1 Tax=Aspergillus ellipticus CBS 707.79 TaxID=1448320 RepID=A0A319EDR6_9EURO|nr:putative FRE ferric reductase-like transmembrane component [Aspergillus ellipticus CBS 707.79]
MQCIATITAMVREVSYPQYTPTRTAWARLPSFGSIILVAAYLAFILILEFIDNDITGAQHYQALSVQAAWLAVAQIPLIVLLVGKNSLVGILSGTSYQRLNILHRWVARGLLLLSTFHFGFESYGWNQYGLMQMEWNTDSCPPTGIAAYAILLWMNLTTFVPIRFHAYNLFVVQHILTYFGLIIAIMMHLPSTALYSRVYVYIAIAFYLIERLVRTARYAYTNISPGQATLESLGNRATKIHLTNSRLRNWTPGSHVLIAIPRFGIAQSHPATIISTPKSHGGELVLILKTCRGFTRRLAKAATVSDPSSKSDLENLPLRQSYLALIEGPYPPASQTDLACYDTLFLVAGGTGITFTMSVLLDIAARATTRKLPPRNIHFIWIVKDRTSLPWIRQELLDVVSDLQHAGINFQTQAFLTCDNEARNEKDAPIGCHSPETGSEESLAAPPWNEVWFQRPVIDSLLWPGLCAAEGETAIAVSGPLRLCAELRTTVAKISDERAVHKGSGAQGIYLHVENCE